VLDGSTLNGPMINGGQASNLTLNGAQIDCTSRVCTQPPGICDGSIASTAFVCTAISNAISGANPAFCDAVSNCLLSISDSLCPTVFTCINTTNGIINNVAAFGPGSYATQADWGVTRYATKSELEQAICGVSFEPCTLREFFLFPNLASPLWMAFSSAVAASSTAVLNNAALTGTPTAPTAAAGTNSTQIATTAFVNTAINNAISAANPAFCAAVAACSGGGSCSDVTNLFATAGGNPGAGVGFLGNDCMSYTAAQIVAAGGGGGGGATLVVKGVTQLNGNGDIVFPSVLIGCTFDVFLRRVTFTVPFANNSYQVFLTITNGTGDFFIINQTSTSFDFSEPPGGGAVDGIYWEIYQ
jgi:hypothetical protein